MKIHPIRRLAHRCHDSALVRSLIRKLERTCASAYNAGIWSHDINGERWLIRALAAHWQMQGTAPIVFDVGANVGAWAYALLLDAPAAQVHCFEPMPAIFKTLSENLKSRPGAQCNAFGLSDADGPMDLYENYGWTEERTFRAWTSLNISPGPVWYDQPSRYAIAGHLDKKIRVRMVRGDGYAAEQDIKAIHALKIDAEGMDLQVLLGMGEFITQGKIDLIQFERIETGHIDSPQFKDYLRVLVDQYEIGRLYPDGVKFRDWRATWSADAIAESVHDGNYVAVARCRPELLAHLRCGAPHHMERAAPQPATASSGNISRVAAARTARCK